MRRFLPRLRGAAAWLRFLEYFCEKEEAKAGSDLDQSCGKELAIPCRGKAGAFVCHDGREGAVLVQGVWSWTLRNLQSVPADF